MRGLILALLVLSLVERGVLKQRLDQVEHELYQEGLEGGATKGAA